MLQRLELGFAISYPLVVALDRMQDKCLQRYTLHSLGLMIGSKLLWQSLVSLSFVTLAFNSAGESGWTHYLDYSSLSESYFQMRGGIEDHGAKGARVEEEEEDLSMISDASSGPQHYHEDDGQHYCVNWYPSTSHYTKELKKKKNNNRKAK
ncbi:hypothetical protein GmHk_06G017043 [Glycine max]|nr:hypothetical protein GmHk_06G017043 [Glycine max]